jgi:predicted TIM-barrel fold metal-dependent hydrolase
VTYLLGHSGGVPVGFREAIEVAQTCPNVYLDICCSTMSSVWLERIVSEVGSDRVLFGTDMPFLDPTYLVGRLACAALGDADKRRVFGQNAETLYVRAQRVERNA